MRTAISPSERPMCSQDTKIVASGLSMCDVYIYATMWHGHDLKTDRKHGDKAPMFGIENIVGLFPDIYVLVLHAGFKL